MKHHILVCLLLLNLQKLLFKQILNGKISWQEVKITLQDNNRRQSSKLAQKLLQQPVAALFANAHLTLCVTLSANNKCKIVLLKLKH